MQKPKPGEYVAVAAILGVMIVVLYPVLSHIGPRPGNGAECHSHLRQVGMALSEYVQDNDWYLPPVGDGKGRHDWRTSIVTYLHGDWKPFTCPDRKELNAPENGFMGVEGEPESYAANIASGSGSGGLDRGPFSLAHGSLPLPKIPYPACAIAVCEIQNTHSPGFDIDAPPDGAKQSLYAGHRGWSNYLFVDGHVQAYRPVETASYQLYSFSSPTNFWYADGQKPLSVNGVQTLKAAQDANRN